MLRQLLNKVAAGTIGNTSDLAAELGAEPAMVDAMVRELEQRGLLQRLGECGETCGGCSSDASCGMAQRRSAWMLTAAGRRLAST